MFKFFRRIRQQLLSKNRIRKYFLYAIGEIILVVIGILIALQINNWNEASKDALREQQILKQLNKEYIANLIQLEEKIVMRNEMIAASSTILKYIDKPEKVQKDSLIYQLSLLGRDPTFDPISNDLISSGNLHLIKNDSLKQMLSRWTSEVYQLQEIELEWQKMRTEIFTPITIKLGVSRDIQNTIWKDGFTPIHALDKTFAIRHEIKGSKQLPDVKQILSNVALEGVVSEVIGWNHIANIQSKALRKKIKELLNVIQSEIKN